MSQITNDLDSRACWQALADALDVAEQAIADALEIYCPHCDQIIDGHGACGCDDDLILPADPAGVIDLELRAPLLFDAGAIVDYVRHVDESADTVQSASIRGDVYWAVWQALESRADVNPAISGLVADTAARFAAILFREECDSLERDELAYRFANYGQIPD